MIEPATDWPTNTCEITSEHESIVDDIFDLIYRTAEDCISDNDLEGTHQAHFDAKTLAESTESIEFLGTGAGRFTITGDILTSPDHVLKIARYSPREVNTFPADGISQNRIEATTWEYLPPALAPWFTPITATQDDYKWLIQPRVDTTTPLPPWR